MAIVITQAIWVLSTEWSGRVALHPLVSKVQCVLDTVVLVQCSALSSCAVNMICDTMRVKVCEKVVNCKGLALVRSYIEALVNIVLFSVSDLRSCDVILESWERKGQEMGEGSILILDDVINVKFFRISLFKWRLRL